MKRPSVDPAFAFAVALILSLVLWYPTLRGTLDGDIDITDAGIRYFLALAIAWAGTYCICALVAMYASQPRKPSSPPPGTAAAPGRRREDAPVPESEPANQESDVSAA
jgi:hypothetical protein